MRETFPILGRDLPRLWSAYYAAEVVLSCTSEHEEDGSAYAYLLALLRSLQNEEPCKRALFFFLGRILQIAGCVPVADQCAHCGKPLRGSTRFDPSAGGGVCGDCATADPASFSVSPGALAILRRLVSGDTNPASLRITRAQAHEIQRAFDEQIQYHLGRPLRSVRLARYFAE